MSDSDSSNSKINPLTPQRCMKSNVSVAYQRVNRSGYNKLNHNEEDVEGTNTDHEYENVSINHPQISQKLSSASDSTVSKHSKNANDKYQIDDYVLLTKKRKGIIRFIGNVKFTKGKLYGIELLNKLGKHDGMKNNIRYFQTADKRAVFVRENIIQNKIIPITKIEHEVIPITNETVYSDEKLRLNIYTQGFDRNSKMGVIKMIQYWADQGQHFDIYQIMSFRWKSQNKWKSPDFLSTVGKTILCLMIQLPAIIFICYQLIKDTNKEWCNLEDTSFENIYRKFLAFGLSIFLGSYIWVLYEQIQLGMYCLHFSKLENLPPFLNRTWLTIGYYYNLCLYSSAWLASYIVIFLSDSAIDLVLNSVALFFLAELDGILVSWYDYKAIKKFVDNYLECDEVLLKMEEQKKIESASEIQENNNPHGFCRVWLSYLICGYWMQRISIYILPLFIVICS